LLIEDDEFFQFDPAPLRQPKRKQFSKMFFVKADA